MSRVYDWTEYDSQEERERVRRLNAARDLYEDELKDDEERIERKDND